MGFKPSEPCLKPDAVPQSLTSFQVGIFWTILTTVLFIFPPAIPVKSSSMNYCIVAFGVMFLIAGGTWVLGGRSHYQGPQIELQREAIDGVVFSQGNGVVAQSTDEISEEVKASKD